MWMDLLILLAFVIYSISLGLYFRKKASRDLENYFLAGRDLQRMACGDQHGSNPICRRHTSSCCGFSRFLWNIFPLAAWVYVIAFFLMGFLFGGFWRRAKILTDAELMELRYAGKGAEILRVIKAFHLGALVNCTVLAVVLMAGTRIAELFLPWHEWLPSFVITPLTETVKKWNIVLTTIPQEDPRFWTFSANNLISVGVIVFFTWLYSTTGGLRSVVATDIVQFAVIMLGTISYAVIVIMACGGFRQMGVQLQDLYGKETTEAI
ncbi:MAG: hypothetical protein WB791_00005 [Waddliaceae bacterium]